MKEFTSMILMVSELLAVSFFIWLIIQCKSTFTGFMTTCAALAACWAIYRYAAFIALAIIWGVRFAAVIGIVAFVLGIYPKPHHWEASDNECFRCEEDDEKTQIKPIKAA